MACIPLAYPPMSPAPKLEPESTPGPSHHAHAPAWKLPNLGPYPTSFPGTNGVQKRKKRQAPRFQYQPNRSIAHLSPDEQIVELRQSRKTIKSKLYSRIARLQRECDALQQEYYATPDDSSTPFARATRFWPTDHAAKPRDLFAHTARDLDPYHHSSYATRPARMVRYDAPEDEILIYTSASCLNQHTTSAPRRAASSCLFKPSGLPTSEARSMALRLERRGPNGQEYPQESNRAHLRAAIAALQCRQWHEEGWSAVTIASDSEYLVEGITNRIEIWQQNGWLTSKELGNRRDGDAVANGDLWELLLWEVMEQAQLGLEVRFWLIMHDLNAEAHAEARMAAELLKEEESFCRMPFAEEMPARLRSAVYA